MVKSNIARIVSDLIGQYKERDPFAICKELDIEIMKRAMCEEIKGYFFMYEGVRIIVLNLELEKSVQKVICAHELGHALLHEHIADRDHFTADFSVYDPSAKPELQANLFAAELLIGDEEVLSRLEYDDNYFSIARDLEISPQLLDFKIRMMQAKGHALADFVNYRGDYLKQK